VSCPRMQYAKLEEDYGLARHAMAIYDRATKAVPDDKKLDMFMLYIKKVGTSGDRCLRVVSTG
jgi:hypothetical protein